MFFNNKKANYTKKEGKPKGLPSCIYNNIHQLTIILP